MSNKKRFFRDGAMLTVVALSSRSVSIIFSSLLAAWVGSEGVGLFTLIMTVYSFGITIATSGIGLTVTRLVAANYEKRAATLKASLAYSSIFGVASSMLMFLLSGFISVRLLSRPEAGILLEILAPTLLLVALTATFNGYFVGVKRVRANATVQIFSQLARIAVCFAFITIFGKSDIISSLTLICLGILATELFSFILILIQYFFDAKKYKTEEGDRVKLGTVSSVAMPLALSQYVRSLLLSFEHILIPKRLVKGGLTSAEALSGYGVLHGMSLPTVLFPMSPLSSFSGLLVPEFAEDEAKGNRERMSRLTSESINVTLTYAATVAVFIFFFAEELGFALYSSFDAGRYLRILAPVIPIMYLDHVTDQILKGIGEQVYSMWVNIADSCLSLVLVYFLLPKLGVLGYALVIIIMEAFNFLMSLFRLLSRVKIRANLLASLFLPAIFSLISCLVTGEMFVFNGAASASPWLVCKIIFAICVFVFLHRFCVVFLCNFHKNKKMAKKY